VLITKKLSADMRRFMSQKKSRTSGKKEKAARGRGRKTASSDTEKTLPAP